jgi:type IV pilus assembly protein PilB
LVFSTLHTNDAPSAITRLNDIGVAPFLTASSVIAVMAQRLVRLVCPKCKEADKPPAHEIKAAGLTPTQAQNANFMRGRGCSNCNHTGYRGRKGIYEMMRMSNVIREMTFNREPSQAIRRQARLAGMRTLLEDGVNKAVAGVTTLEEVLSTCHHESD